MLAPNQQLIVTRQGLSAPRAVDASLASSWTTGRLVFHALPLQQAVAEVNRYSTTKVILDGSSHLGAQPVSGVFDVGDTPAFVAAVTTLFPLQAKTGGHGTVHLAPAAPPARTTSNG